MPETTVARWGDALAITIPPGVVQEAGLAEGDHLAVSVADHGVLLRSMRSPYSLEGLVAGITDENRHAETDWGAPVGNEVW